MSLDYKSSCIAFYELYAPEAVKGVDTQRRKGAGGEEEVVQSPLKKYATGHDSGAGNAEDWSTYYRRRLVRFYTTYAPEKLDVVDQQLTKYRGKEEALFGVLEGMYGPEPVYVAPDIDAGEEKSTTPNDNIFYRTRLMTFCERYAPAKVGLLDSYLEKYRGREAELIAALEREYVHINGFAFPSTTASGRVSPGSFACAENTHHRMYVDAVNQFSSQEATARRKLGNEFVEELCVLCMRYESEVRDINERNVVIVFFVLTEECKRGLLCLKESMGRSAAVHPSFPFMNEDARVLEKFFASLGTISVNGECLIDRETCYFLIAAAVGKGAFSKEQLSHPSKFQQQEKKFFSLNDFRQLLTQNCLNEVDVVAKMHEFLSAVMRRTKPLRLNVTGELHIGFWAYRCVKPCLVEYWERAWVVLDEDSRLLLSRPNAVKPEVTIILDHVLHCQLSSMLSMRAPRSCANNGLYLQLSHGPNPVLLLLCPQKVQHAHALVRHIHQYCKKEAIPALGDATWEKGEWNISLERILDDSGGNSTKPSVTDIPVWCCRSGSTSFVRSFWSFIGDSIVHRTEGDKRTYLWRMASVREVYIATELGVRPPLTISRYAFVVAHKKGSLLCYAESRLARDTLVANMKRALVKQFLLSYNAPHDSPGGISNTITRTYFRDEGGYCGFNGGLVEEGRDRIPGFAQSTTR